MSQTDTISVAPIGRPAPRWGVSLRRRSAVTTCILAAVAVIATLLLGLAFEGGARAQDAGYGPREDGLIRQDQLDRGGLLFETDQPGLYVPAPLLSTDIDIAVSGAVTRAVVTQRFQNPASVFVEGKYLFPLPEGAAVDTLRMRVADRLIEGEIKEREEAQQIYEQAAADGFVASLVEQERPNVFTTSVANIAPNAEVVVQIEYQQTLAPRDGAFGLRVPLVVAPRYSPDPRPMTVEFGPEGWTLTENDPVPDRARVSGPVADPRDDADGEIRNPVTLRIDLDAGFPLGPVLSPYHEISVTAEGLDSAVITLDGPAPADRDFFLSWTPATLSEPHLALYTEETGAPGADAHYVLMISPPAAEAIGAERRPRQVVYVQDISGSMHGESMDQAKRGLEMALERLAPEDAFNIIVFNDRYGLLFDEPVPATAENLSHARSAVRALEADGGTEMLPALRAALDTPEPADGRLAQVIFLTDGAVGNELEMLELIESDLGDRRLFTVGIGSAPNSYFMTAAAEAGRGSHVFIGDLAEVGARMEALFAKIEIPAMTDVSVAVELPNGAAAPRAEIWPSPAPDLYVGDPLVSTVRLGPSRAPSAELVVRGVRDGETWERRVPLEDAELRPGVSKLYARERIRSLEALRLSVALDQSARDRLDAEILGTALGAGLVSRLTSLVAVDVTPTRGLNEELVSRDVARNLPQGWDPEKFFDAGAEAQPSDAGAEPAALEIEEASLEAPALERLAAAAAVRAAAQGAAAAGAAPPVGAIGWAPMALLGALMMALGLALLCALGRAAPARDPRA